MTTNHVYEKESPYLRTLTAADIALIDGRYGLAEFIFANDPTKLMSDAIVLAEKIVSSWLPEVVHAATEQGRNAGRKERLSPEHDAIRNYGAVISDNRHRF